MSLGIVRPPHEEAAEGPLHVLNVVEQAVLERLGPMMLGLTRALGEREIASTYLTDAAITALQLGFDASVVRSVTALTGWQRWWHQRELRAQLEGNFDLVHYWGVSSIAAVGPWARREQVPGIVYVSADSDIRNASHGIQRGVFVVPATPAYAQRLIKLIGGSRCGEPVRLAIEPPKLMLNKAPESHLPVIMWSGRMEEVAGLNLLAEAVRILHEAGLEFQVALLSLGGNADAAWAALRSRKVDGMFSLVESVHMIALGLAAADVFVVPAAEPAARLVPLEALSTGTRIIVSDAHRDTWARDCPQIVRFEAGSAPKLAECLRAALRGLEKASEPEVIAAARQYVHEEYGLERAVKAWETLYRRQVAQHRAATMTE